MGFLLNKGNPNMNKKLLVATMLLTFGSQNFIDAKKKKVQPIVNLDGSSELIEAIKLGKKSPFKKALKVGNVNFVDKHGKTAMDYAAEKNNKKFILKMAPSYARVTNENNRVIILSKIEQQISACKRAGITSMLTGSIALGTNQLLQRSLWKTIKSFYNDPKVALA